MAFGTNPAMPAMAGETRPSRYLDSPPPGPPGGMRRAQTSLVDSQMRASGPNGAGAVGGGPGGIGMAGGDPQVGASRAIAKIEEGLTELGAFVPSLVSALNQLPIALRQAVVQALADQLAGTDSPGAAGIGGASSEMPMPPGAMAGMAGGGGPGGGAPPPGPPPMAPM